MSVTKKAELSYASKNQSQEKSLKIENFLIIPEFCRRDNFAWKKFRAEKSKFFCAENKYDYISEFVKVRSLSGQDYWFFIGE